MKKVLVYDQNGSLISEKDVASDYILQDYEQFKLVKVLVFDSLGVYQGDKLEHTDYVALTNEHIDDGVMNYNFYTPKLVNGQVVEGLTQAEIDARINVQPAPTEIDKIKEDNVNLNLQLIDLWETLLNSGVIQ